MREEDMPSGTTSDGLDALRQASVLALDRGEALCAERWINIQNDDPGLGPCADADVRARVLRPPSAYGLFICRGVQNTVRHGGRDRVLARMLAIPASTGTATIMNAPHRQDLPMAARGVPQCRPEQRGHGSSAPSVAPAINHRDAVLVG